MLLLKGATIMNKEVEYGFHGVTLDSNQRKRLSEYARSVLGDEYYNQIDEFFTSVWESSAKYKVFLARRCLNLMYLMYRAKYDKPLESQQSFYSDGALLANAFEIADSYITWGVIPEIMIVDDILLHGRTLNALIDSLVESVYKCLKNRGYFFEKNEIEYEILNSITIRVMVQNAKPLLIRSKYYQHLKSKSDLSDVWVPRDWHELSSRISKLIAEGFFCNTSYVLSLYESNNDTLLHESFEMAAKKLGFECSEWNRRFKRNVWVKALRNCEGEVVAFYTFRITQNAIDKKYRIIPFVIMSDFEYDSYSIDFIDDYINFKINTNTLSFGSERLRAEAIYLLISHNLLLLLQNETGKKLITSQNLDVDKICISFRNGIVDEEAIKKMAELEKPILSWDEMNQFILQSTKNSDALLSSSNEQITSQPIDYQNLMGEILAKEGEEIERNAFWEYSGKTEISEKTSKKPITSLFSKVVANIGSNNNENPCIKETVGFLLRFMDTGVVALGTRNVTSHNHHIISCVYRAGEQSQFIHPKKYSQELPVLIKMERDCVSNLAEINKRVDRFYAYDGNLSKNLKEFVRMLYSSGQQLKDWDINFLDWSEIEEKMYKDSKILYQEKQTKEQNVFCEHENELISQMILNTSKQLQELRRYNEMYPEQIY